MIYQCIAIIYLHLLRFFPELQRFRQIDLSLEELEDLVDESTFARVSHAKRVALQSEREMYWEEGGKCLHYRHTDPEDRLPFVPIQRNDGEEALQEGRVE